MGHSHDTLVEYLAQVFISLKLIITCWIPGLHKQKNLLQLRIQLLTLTLKSQLATLRVMNGSSSQNHVCWLKEAHRTSSYSYTPKLEAKIQLVAIAITCCMKLWTCQKIQCIGQICGMYDYGQWHGRKCLEPEEGLTKQGQSKILCAQILWRIMNSQTLFSIHIQVHVVTMHKQETIVMVLITRV